MFTPFVVTVCALTMLAAMFAAGWELVRRMESRSQERHDAATKVARVYFPVAGLALLIYMFLSNFHGSSLVTGTTLAMFILSIMCTEYAWFQPRERFDDPVKRA